MNMRTSNIALFALSLAIANPSIAQDHAHHDTPPETASADDASDAQASPAAAPAEQAARSEATHDGAAHGGSTAQPPSQTTDHAAMGHDMPPPAGQGTHAEHVDHAAMGHDMPQVQGDTQVDHAAMGHSDAAPTQQADHTGMNHAGMDHAGMDDAGMDHAGMDHAGMDHAAMGHEMPAAADTPRTPIPKITDADRAAAFGYTGTHAAHDNTIQHYVLLDRLEGFDTDEGGGMAWEAQSWIGTDRDKLWLRSEGERVGGHTEAANLEVLYGRAFARWWDAVVGIRHDFKPGQSQDFLAVGVIGMAPYKFEVEATAYLGERGQTAASVEFEYETLLTNRLILQPLVEVSLYGKDDPARGIGSGLSSVEAGLRLRYEFTRKFAPYVGVVHERVFGNTADLRRDEGEDIDDTHMVIGVRTWF
jgi:copper resistance protein B